MESEEFKCTVGGCLKMYSNAFNLKRHIESFHMHIKKFFCSICNKGLSSKQNLREHNNIHLGVKPYICKYRRCTEAFRQASQLTLHQNMHAEVDRMLYPEKSRFLSDIAYLTRMLSVNVDVVKSEIMQYSNEIDKVELPPIRFKFYPEDSD